MAKRRHIFTLAALTAISAFVPASAQAAVTEAKDFDSFSRAFCAASHDESQIFVLPIQYFGEGRTVDCDGDTYTLRGTEPVDDPGHLVLNIDPPSGVETAFDCDGKADVGIEMVAVNCLPVSAEAAGHKKP